MQQWGRNVVLAESRYPLSGGPGRHISKAKSQARTYLLLEPTWFLDLSMGWKSYKVGVDENTEVFATVKRL